MDTPERSFQRNVANRIDRPDNGRLVDRDATNVLTKLTAANSPMESP
jgi:hypothetical protein